MSVQDRRLLKALAARDNSVPFYIALPSPTIDFTVDDGVREIPIEQRAADEVTMKTGRTSDGRSRSCGWFRKDLRSPTMLLMSRRRGSSVSSLPSAVFSRPT